MIKYNIYNGNNKVNKTALSFEELKTVLRQKYINKFNNTTGEIEQINTNNLHIIKCYVV